ncbi:MAG: hypothetical protein ABI672_12865 [Vicinamibacteria bacterium]
MNYTEQLNSLVSEWDDNESSESTPAWSSRLQRILFHSEYRYTDYRQFSSEGAFPKRLFEWLKCGASTQEKQALLRAASALTFLDRGQMRSLYRDGFRRILLPWLMPLTPLALRKNPKSHSSIVVELRRHVLVSITDSFSFSDFMHENDLAGLSRPHVLGEAADGVEAIVAALPSHTGIVVFEDLVGTGKQALGALKALRARTSVPIYFLPLILFHSGQKALIEARTGLMPFKFEGVFLVDEGDCVRRNPTGKEPEDHSHVRALALNTKTRVLERNDATDDPPDNELGYRDTGGLLVTAHNTPNNTLPLFHHRAPSWSPLFRRVHNCKDGL